MLSGILLLVLSLLVLLTIPLTVAFQLAHRQAVSGHLLLLWGFGLLRVRIPLSATTPSAAGRERTPAKSVRPRRRERSRASPLALLRCRSLRRRLLRFVSDLWQAVHKRNLMLYIRLGLDDPADTGQLWAVVGPVAAILADLDEARVEIEPEFTAAVFELESSGAIRIIPLQLLYLVVMLLCSPALWRGIRLMHKG